MKFASSAIAILALLITSSGGAKCPSKTFLIDIQVHDRCTQAPISGAAAILFADDDDSAVNIRDDNGVARDLRTGSDGVAHAQFWFNLASGSGFFGDRCNARLRTLEAIVVAPQYDIQRVRVRASVVGRRNGKPLLRGTAVTLLPSAGDGSCYSHQTSSPNRDWSPNPSLQRTIPARSRGYCR